MLVFWYEGLCKAGQGNILVLDASLALVVNEAATAAGALLAAEV
jgi:hypothetical protein